MLVIRIAAITLASDSAVTQQTGVYVPTPWVRETESRSKGAPETEAFMHRVYGPPEGD